MFFHQYTDDEYQDMQSEAAESIKLATRWQFDEEIKYQRDMEISYPQDEKAVLASKWLAEHEIPHDVYTKKRVK